MRTLQHPLIPIRVKKGLQPPVIEVGNLKPRGVLDVSDTVRGFYLTGIKAKRGEAYNLCASKAREMREVLNAAIQLSGVKVKIRFVAHLMRSADKKIILGSTAKFRKHTAWKPHLVTSAFPDFDVGIVGKGNIVFATCALSSWPCSYREHDPRHQSRSSRWRVGNALALRSTVRAQSACIGREEILPSFAG